MVTLYIDYIVSVKNRTCSVILLSYLAFSEGRLRVTLRPLWLFLGCCRGVEPSLRFNIIRTRTLTITTVWSVLHTPTALRNTPKRLVVQDYVRVHTFPLRKASATLPVRAPCVGWCDQNAASNG